MRPGFELGYKRDGKYYLHNHLVFNILVYQTHGEYTAAKQKYGNSLTAAEAALDTRHRWAVLGRRPGFHACMHAG